MSISEFNREELQTLALHNCPTALIYDLRDDIDSIPDDILKIIAESKGVADLLPYDLGRIAFLNEVSIPAWDETLMEWIANNTGSKVGSGIEPMKKWLDGWNYQQDQEMKVKFPEMYS